MSILHLLGPATPFTLVSVVIVITPGEPVRMFYSVPRPVGFKYSVPAAVEVNYSVPGPVAGIYDMNGE
jgi:hypothetical protein